MNRHADHPAGGAFGPRLKPCGPIVDAEAAKRTRDVVAEAAAAAGEGWVATLDEAWPALAPAFAASPYLAGLARREPTRLRRILEQAPEARLDLIVAEVGKAGETAEPETAGRALRRLKAELHLLTALADLGGVWDLDQVTSALTRFADAAVGAALAAVARAEQARGRLLALDDPGGGPIPGLFCLALGKHGAFELNYSSDIDISVFYDPAALPSAPGVERQDLAIRLTQAFAALLQARTDEGYVFRVDLRLRPDPASTPVAVPVDAALDYYQSAGQNWERAAMIKARPCGGDLAHADAFMAELKPFIWRRSLDYAAIADIQAIKQQIHVHKADERLTAPGTNLKLGAGGIREIEFFVQTQQLILGGRDPSLRAPRTLDALAALTAAGHVAPKAAEELAEAYRRLRAWEHRVQMVADEQTHVLPEDDAARRRVAALSGFGDLRRFDLAVSKTLQTVNARYGELFAEAEPLSSSFGSLVFTGVEDDPETLDTLARMGFSDPTRVSGLIRGWHHGHIPATRTERGRELFTRLAPRLLEAAQATGAADAAFNRFADFFCRLATGVQVQSLFLAKPELFELVVEVMAFTPALASTLGRQPSTLDTLLDPGFFAPLEPGEIGDAVHSAVRAAEGFEGAMDAVRRAHREQTFRIGVQIMSGAADADHAGPAFAALADACLAVLAPAALAETERVAGAFPGEAAVIALGKAGSCEMTAGSDLDLMTLYAAEAPIAMSALKDWGAETFYARFTQRLTTALSAPTAEGELYAVDLRLRPSGKAGPVAVSLAAFERYHAAEAETWEALALTRARVAWASSDTFADACRAAIETALRRPRDPVRTRRDIAEMRDLMMRERPPRGPWDLKLSEGGLVDIEFAAQGLQILYAADGGPLRANTAAALAALRDAELGEPEAMTALENAWTLQQNLRQVQRLALHDDVDPKDEPAPLRALLARAGGVRSFQALTARLARARTRAHRAFEAVVAAPRPSRRARTPDAARSTETRARPARNEANP